MERITASIDLWKAKRKLGKKPNETQRTDYIECTENDEELMEALLALTALNEHTKEGSVRDPSKGDTNANDTFHNTPIWDKSQEIEDIFLLDTVIDDCRRSQKTNQDISALDQITSTTKTKIQRYCKKGNLCKISHAGDHITLNEKLEKLLREAKNVNLNKLSEEIEKDLIA